LFFANEVIFGDTSKYVNEEILKIKKPTKIVLNLFKLGLASKAQGGQNILKGLNSAKNKSQGSVKLDQSFAKNQLYTNMDGK